MLIDPVWETKVRAFAARLRKATSYELPNGTPPVFERARSWLTAQPLSPRLAKLSQKGSDEKAHFAVLKNGAWPTGNLHLALIRCQYHRDRVAAYVQAVHECIDPELVSHLDRGALGIGHGNKLCLHFEYQAFIMAARTSLDYLARTVNAYFGNQGNSFNDLPAALEKARPRDIAKELSAVVAPFYDGLSHFYGTGQKKSVRDLISHYYFVPAAHLNLRADGAVLFGGGEGLNGEPLVDVLDRHFALITQTVVETLTRLIDLDQPPGSVSQL
ncbi:MAG: hypothetical protein ACLQDQ_05440 [Myxococcaceae bacterium]